MKIFFLHFQSVITQLGKISMKKIIFVIKRQTLYPDKSDASTILPDRDVHLVGDTSDRAPLHIRLTILKISALLK